MKGSRTLIVLSWAVGALALVYAGFGLFVSGGDGGGTFTTLHGQIVQLYGQGIYRYDTLLIGAGLRGTDVVTLLVGLPLLIWAIMSYQRGSLRGGMLLSGALSYFLYNAASLALGAAYNSLFLLYIAGFSAGLFAFGLVLTAIEDKRLVENVSSRMAHRGIAIFLIVAGVVTALIWLIDIVPALLQGDVPATLGSYTTIITYVLDLGIITPAAVLAGVLLLRRAPWGYRLAASLLVLNLMIGLAVIAQTVSQLLAGYAFTPVQFGIFTGSWVVLSFVALGFTVNFFRSFPDDAGRAG